MAEIHKFDFAAHRDDELISRYLDGEATADDCAKVEAALGNNSAFAARFAVFQENDALLKSLHVDSEPSVPPSLIAKLTVAEKPSSSTARRSLFAIAASVTLAVALGLALKTTNPDSDLTPRMSRALASALETLPSRAQGWDTLEDGSELRAVLTFPAADGNWCREFMLASNENHWRGVACRENNTWVTQVIGREVFLDRESGYRPAGAQDNDHVARFIDSTATDVALSASTERRLIQTNWASK